MFFPLSILHEAAITGHCSNYSGYNVFDVDFGDNYVFKHCTRRRTFRCLMVGEVMGSHVFLCGTGGHSLALAKLNDHTAELFLEGWRWEFIHVRLWQRGRAPLQLLHHNAGAHQLCSGCDNLMRACEICLSYSLERTKPMISVFSIPLPSTYCCVLPFKKPAFQGKSCIYYEQHLVQRCFARLTAGSYHSVRLITILLFCKT